MPCHGNRTSAAARYLLPCGELPQAEIEIATGPSQNCGKKHEKTSTTDGVVWLVRGDSVAGGRTGPGANPSASANAIFATRPDAGGTSADGAAEHCECGRQRSDVRHHVRAACRGFRIQRQLRQLDGVPGANERTVAAAAGAGGGRRAGILQTARTAGSRSDTFEVFVVWPGVRARARLSTCFEAE